MTGAAWSLATKEHTLAAGTWLHSRTSEAGWIPAGLMTTLVSCLVHPIWPLCKGSGTEWWLRDHCLSSNPSSSTYQLYKPLAKNLILCASIFLSVKWEYYCWNSRKTFCSPVLSLWQRLTLTQHSPHAGSCALHGFSCLILQPPQEGGAIIISFLNQQSKESSNDSLKVIKLEVGRIRIQT